MRPFLGSTPPNAKRPGFAGNILIAIAFVTLILPSLCFVLTYMLAEDVLPRT